jgi:hypothetical protein
MEHGHRLGRLSTGANWWVGDWVRYGVARYGERYTLAARLTGYDVQTLMNLAYVASRFEVSGRRKGVSWSHHSELAALEPHQQRYWLDRVVTDRLSHKDLRKELRSARAKASRDATDPALSEAHPERRPTCPTCGRPLAQARLGSTRL